MDNLTRARVTVAEPGAHDLIVRHYAVLEIGMCGVDAGIDDRDADAGPIDDLTLGVEVGTAGHRSLRHSRLGRPRRCVPVEVQTPVRF